MSTNIQIISTVLGGLAIFLYGMTLMSDGLREASGEKMKAVLGYMTRNRFFAILAGTVVTGLIQSSSATSVMTVGFVNAGLLSLQQAIGVIFGANIGTTITGQLVSFKLSDIALPAVALGVIGLMFTRKVVSRGAWRTVLGFGLLFYGMNLMTTELKVLSGMPRFISFFSTFDCTPTNGYLPPLAVLGAIAVGTLCTMLVQSSSATIGITIALAETGVISVWTAVPIVLGDNIGTTITAALAAIGANANARRTALAHALFNLIGTCLVTLSFALVTTSSDGMAAPVFLQLVEKCTEGRGLLGENPGRFVAMAHTIFNVSNVIVLSAFIPLLARICTKLIPDRRRVKASMLEPRLLSTPELAVSAAVRALSDMTRRATTLVNVAVKSGLGDAAVSEESIRTAEDEIDRQQLAIRDYLVSISQQKLSEHAAKALPEIVHCVNDAERISDLALILSHRTAKGRANIGSSDRELLRDILHSIRHLSRSTLAALKGDTLSMRLAHDQEQDVIDQIREANAISAASLRANESGEKSDGLVLIGVLAPIRDIARHLGNIAARANQIG